MSKNIEDGKEGVDYVVCKVCGKKVRVLNNFHFKRCLVSYDEYAKSFGKKCMACENSHQKRGLSRKKRPEHSKKMTGSGNPMFGKKRTKKEKRLMSKNRKGKGVGVCGKYKRTEEIKEKISSGVAQAYIDGRLNSGSYYKHGYVYSHKLKRKVFYRSSWEKFVIKYLDKHPNVEFFEEEPLKIKYFDPSRNKNRYYIPDFLVKYDCGIKEIWEVKPSYLVKNDETTKSKVKAANKFLEENSDIHNGFIITEKEIEMMKTYDFVDKATI